MIRKIEAIYLESVKGAKEKVLRDQLSAKVLLVTGVLIRNTDLYDWFFLHDISNLLGAQLQSFQCEIEAIAVKTCLRSLQGRLQNFRAMVRPRRSLEPR
jgi:hypothetical protein